MSRFVEIETRTHMEVGLDLATLEDLEIPLLAELAYGEWDEPVGERPRNNPHAYQSATGYRLVDLYIGARDPQGSVKAEGRRYRLGPSLYSRLTEEQRREIEQETGELG